MCHLPFIDVAKGPGSREYSASRQSLASKEELEAAGNLGMNLYGVSKKYQKELSEVFDKQTAGIGASLWDINYDAFSTICSDVLRRTINNVANRWDQALLVFANYVQLKEGLKGDTSRQNEIASYIGRYLSDMGFQTWIQLQGGWVSNHKPIMTFLFNIIVLCRNL